jgi:cation diffusion facilitator CzcD-associated flavoprotein CzcO
MDGGGSEHLDVLVIGAGISGISAGYHLQDLCPDKSYAILEGRENLGGTWDVFRYPGIRSDSDMLTLGYHFKPWTAKESIADGASILEYLREAAEEHGIDQKIRCSHRVVHANWSSEDLRWEVEVLRTDTEEIVHLTCGFLMLCSGYYSYEEGHMPTFEGVERFGGTVVHPQNWPEDLDYAGKRVVVIGSGATAITLVPALAEKAEHVTMLQRSPTYIIAAPAVDRAVNAMRHLLPKRAAYALARRKNVAMNTAIFGFSRRWPKAMRWVIRKGTEHLLPSGYDVATHFNPHYDPWTQRMCVAPDGDLFKAISAGTVSVATDEIAHFTEQGIELSSGKELEADVIITATGLKVVFGGGMRLTLDGEEIDPASRSAYKGTLLSGVPNLSFTVGYASLSWTLRSDLVSAYVCRLLNHMDANGYRRCVPDVPDADVAELGLFDLTSNFILRSREVFPSQGSEDPWRVKRYRPDRRQLRRASIEDDTLQFSAQADRASHSESAKSAA